ncbi:MAG TPA: MMPL family transporter [Planctomycetaceae bacterium]|nr:MMPL family transporter [Planctomycetaceae bacterium]
MSQPFRIRGLALLADFLVRYRIGLFVGAVAISAFAFVEASKLTLEQSIESLYALGDPHLLDYRDSKSLFGGDEFVIVVYDDPELLTPDGLARVRSLAEQLSQVPGVQSKSTQNLADVLAPANIPWLVRPLFQLRRDKLIELSRGILIGADQQTTGIVLRLLPEDKAAVTRDETIRGVREISESHEPQAYVVGEPVLVHDMFQYVDQDGQRLFYASLVLLGLTIFALFRSLRWVVLSIVLVAATVAWTKAILVLCGMRLSMVSSMLNSLVTIVGIATVMRVMVYYREQRANGTPLEAFHKTIVELSPAIFWTTVTAAAGFVSLLSSDITPVRSFGTMMTLGTMLVLLTGGMLLPAGVLYKPEDSDIPTGAAEQRLVGLLGGLTTWVERWAGWVIGAVVLLSIASVVGLFRLKLDTDFTRNFRSSSPIVHALDFVETRLGGAGTWEINFPAPHELTPEYLNQVRSFAAKVRELTVAQPDQPEPALTKVVAITDLLDLVPGSTDTTEGIRRKLELISAFQPEFEPSLYNAEAGRMRLVLRAKQREPSEVQLQLIHTVGDWGRAEFHGEAKATGLYVLLTFLIESLLRDQIISFGLCVVLVVVIMVLAYHNLRIALVSLVPNVFPILLVVGAMGWIGVPINVGTAMIAAVSMGLTIDASIFYLYGYRKTRAAGRPLAEALRETHQGFGRALVFGTLALVVGFSVLALSRFIPLVYFGVLVSLAMLGGLIGNLLLLPLLLPLVDKDPQQPRQDPALSVSET